MADDTEHSVRGENGGLFTAATVLRQASKHAERARLHTEARDEIIRSLRHAGLSFREIGKATGLSHTQVANICKQ